ncbi:hypothetical protein KP509_1Z308600 [Ceratopteris richardii]|nr:hypothetical protein KP509_1Z308600 [Ceratopteris richardii]
MKILASRCSVPRLMQYPRGRTRFLGLYSSITLLSFGLLTNDLTILQRDRSYGRQVGCAHFVSALEASPFSTSLYPGGPPAVEHGGTALCRSQISVSWTGAPPPRDATYDGMMRLMALPRPGEQGSLVSIWRVFLAPPSGCRGMIRHGSTEEGISEREWAEERAEPINT